MDASGNAPRGDPSAAPREGTGLGRLGRLTLKELRETLRDRRTLVTLVLMPLLLYPLLSVGFKQIFATSLPDSRAPEYRLGVRTEWEGRWLSAYLGLRTAVPRAEDAPLALYRNEDAEPIFLIMAPNDPAGFDLEKAVREYQVDVAVRVLSKVPPKIDLGKDLAVDIELVYLRDGMLGTQAADYLRRQLAVYTDIFQGHRLARLGVSQRAAAVAARVVPIEGAQTGPAVSLVTLVPLILILMTITGAVYPAIDLTAGERERGTLEILVAAPIPRLGLLVAKYLAVLTVALLTALVNLAMMTATVLIAGLGPLLFGAEGLSPLVLMEVLGLLLLFATFFSAVLLTLTSFARSFKEAQAYLIPLMVISIAPGLLSLVPDLRLTGGLAIAPLVNIVLLGRELLEHRADAGMAAVVVVSTLLYALAALGVAAQFFAAEAVLYATESGWADLFRRPAAARDTPTVGSALFALALIFPAFFVAVNVIARLKGLPTAVQLTATGAATAVLFAGIPLVAARLGRVRPASGFRLVRPRGKGWLAIPAAAALGLSLWTFAHESVVLQMQAGLVFFSEEQRMAAARLAEELRALDPWWILLAMAVAPAVCEELFFRGYLLGALGTRLRPWAAILISGGLFGLFHVVTPGGIVFARLVPTALLGIVLGWVAWRSGSVWPGMVLHACHNGLLLLVVYYEPRLTRMGWGIAEEAHLPPGWLIAGGAAAVAGAGLILLCCRPGRAAQPRPAIQQHSPLSGG
jgi:ABC-2 type transport system permease protein/sodium transport system permease protein